MSEPTLKPGGTYTATVHLYTYDSKYRPANDPAPIVMIEKLNGHPSVSYLVSAEVTFHIPADYNPVASAVASLRAEEAAAVEEFQKKLAEIRTRLAQVQALTMEEPNA
jgi:hypothetical protein